MSQQRIPPDIPTPFRLSRLLASPWVLQTIFTAAALGLADALADRPQRSDDLAATVGAHPGALHRLMSYDFAGIATLVDVGGGYGALLPPIVKPNPDLRAAVFDCRPVARARSASSRRRASPTAATSSRAASSRPSRPRARTPTS